MKIHKYLSFYYSSDMGRKEVRTPKLTTIHLRPEDARFLLRDKRGTEPNYATIRRYVGSQKLKKFNPALESVDESLIEELDSNYGTPLKKDDLMDHAALDNQQFKVYLSAGVIRKFGPNVYAVRKEVGNNRITSYQ